MKRRSIVSLTAGAALGAGRAGHGAWLQAQTPAASIRRVGVPAPSTQAKEEITLKPFFDQMRQLGWVEGQTIACDRVNADDQMERLPALAAGLVARKPELIYAPPAPSAVAAKQATQTIPIVFGIVSDPVGIGPVTSLACPGGNVTGISSIGALLAPKRVELLREILPGAKRIGLPGDFDAAVGRLFSARVDAILAGGSTLAFNLPGRLIDLANQRRVPVIQGGPGSLFTYNALADQLRRSALPSPRPFCYGRTG